MYQTDYILRLIEQIGTLIKRLLSALAEKRPDEALELADEALGLVLDTSPALAGSLTGQGLVTLLSAGGELDVERARLLADVLAARADALEAAGRDAEAEAERERAAVLADAAGGPLASPADAP